MSKIDAHLLKYNHEEKSMKVSFIIYVMLYMESLLEKTDTCHKNFIMALNMAII